MPVDLQIPDQINLTSFISQEAHDLKSPFTRGLGFINLVLKGLDGPISDQVRQDLTIAYQSSLYSLAMMNSLVEIAHIEKANRELIFEAHQVHHLLREMVNDWQRLYPKPDPVEVSFTAPPAWVYVDDIRFRQCLANWVSYIVEFAPISCKVSIVVQEGPEILHFYITSTGLRQRMPPVCDITLYGYIASHYLFMHDGKIKRLVEEPGGACVEFTLPKNKSEVSASLPQH